MLEVFAQWLFAFSGGGYAKFCKTLSDEPAMSDKVRTDDFLIEGCK